jgi:hypothetical protein
MDLHSRSWGSRTFYDRELVLPVRPQIELGLAEADVDQPIRRLRTNRLTSGREARVALLFAYGMAGLLDAKVLVSPGETEGCDFITRVLIDEPERFPVSN